MIMCKQFNFIKRFFLIFVLFQFLFCFSVSAEYLISEEFGYTIDLLDGFYVSDSNSTGYFLQSDFIPIEIIINVIPYDLKYFFINTPFKTLVITIISIYVKKINTPI
jgi:hypothetical protein